MRICLALAAFAAAVLAGCVPAYTLVNPGAVAVGGLTVDAPGAWNKAPYTMTTRLRNDAEMWTRDGPLLDRLVLIPAVADGEPLLIDRKGTAALPAFRADMLPNELEELAESTMLKYFGEGSSAVGTSNLRPHRFGAHRGVLFEIEAAVNDSPDYGGTAGAFVADGKLYMVFYLAAKPYYYEKHLADAQAVIESARLAPGG